MGSSRSLLRHGACREEHEGNEGHEGNESNESNEKGVDNCQGVSCQSSCDAWQQSEDGQRPHGGNADQEQGGKDCFQKGQCSRKEKLQEREGLDAGGYCRT